MIDAALHEHLIREALVNHDLARLRSLASYGFISNSYRLRIWPLLLGFEDNELEIACQSLPNIGQDHSCLHHDYYDTVTKDIARSLCNYDICQEWDQKRLDEERCKLAWIINRIISAHTGRLHYIQGYHDLCSVFLIVADYDPKVAYVLCERVSQFHLREILRPDLNVIIEVLNMLFPLLDQVDRAVATFLIRSNAKSFFALSWVLTWFSHSLYQFQDVARIFDFLLASHPCMPLYIAAAFILMHRDELLNLESDMPMIHQYFQAQTSADISLLLPLADDLFDKYPPYSLFRRCRPKFPLDSVLPVTDLFSLYRQRNPSVDTEIASGFHQFPSLFELNAVPLICIVVIGVILWRLGLALAKF